MALDPADTSDELDESLDTSDHVLRSKWSCVQAGYVKDDFIEYIVKGKNRGPLHNILHFLRISSIRLALKAFVDQFPEEDVQIVNFGCGFDTISLWILQHYRNVTCFDVDTPELLAKKARLMRKAEPIMRLFPAYRDLGNEYIITQRYKMVPVDLNRIEEVETLVSKYKLRNDQPTLFLSEFALVYLPIDGSNKIIQFANQLSTRPCCFVYWEQEMGNELHGSSAYQTIDSQIKRYTELGWEKVCIMDMNTLYNVLITDDEKRRIRKLECLDEIEEVAIVCRHYVIGICGKQADELPMIFDLFAKHRPKDVAKTYTTEEVRAMIKSGTLSQMHPALLNTDWLS
ncbi:hypothetical protein BaOVIS_003580 [Babesia ovis]|uniref:Leucine carboxyl methyltransferase 1 n=1 Tax=Babesia ovis TaxID=5869 RepID=A0A9W5T7W0_BABOV|nr:hypothetical protein BaOVIS_003580 [Babesia ovis]